MRSLAIVVVAVAAAGLLTAAVSGEGHDPERYEPVPVGDHSRSDRDYTALWDLSHGPYGEFTPSGLYSDLVDALIMHSIVSYETIYSLQFVYLEPYDLIVVGTTLAWDEAYTAAELTAIQEYVAAGGALLVMADNPGTPNENINLITEAFGVTCQTDGTQPGSNIVDFESHQIFDGISQLSLASPGALTVGAPSDTMARAEGGEAVVSMKGSCSVIVLGDSDAWSNDYLALADNEGFILGAFECLAAPDSPVEDASWGVIKALFR